MNIDIEALINRVRELTVEFDVNIIAALAILILGIWIAKLIRRVMRKGLDKKALEETLTSFILNLLYFLLLTVVVLAALRQLGIEITSLIAILGAAGLAIGLALQGSLANFASGVLLIIFWLRVEPISVRGLLALPHHVDVIPRLFVLVLIRVAGRRPHHTFGQHLHHSDVTLDNRGRFKVYHSISPSSTRSAVRNAQSAITLTP